MSDRLAGDLSPLGEELSLPGGTVLWREGDPGDHVVFLLDGTLEVTHEPPEGERLVLRTMYPGAVVGELAALDGQARSATVRARSARVSCAYRRGASATSSARGPTCWRSSSGSSSSASATSPPG